MSSILNRLVRVSTLSTQRAGHCSYLLQHVKWCHDQTSHYQHGIPGIPTDGKVVLLKNSNTGSQLYLVGTCHVSKESIELVKKVINSIRPDAIAIELSKDGIKAFENWKPVNVNEDWFSMFLRSMRSPGGLLNKMIRLINNIDERRLLADGIINGGEFEVAMEECRKLKAKLVPIDQDADVKYAKYPISIPLKNCLQMGGAEIKAQIMGYFMDEGARSQTREHMRPMRLYAPELYQAKVEDRDIHMFTRLRRMEEKLIVGVVGMGHMDGIELLWKRAEDAGDNKLRPSTSENGDTAVEKMELGM